MINKKYSSEEWQDLKLLVTLSRCNSSTQKRIYPFLRKEKVTEAQFSVLELLYHKGSFSIKEIIEKTFSSGGTMTVIINNLLKQGLVRKEKSSDDKRVYLIYITDKGRELTERLFESYLENLSFALGVLSDFEKDILIKLLKKLGKNNTN